MTPLFLLLTPGSVLGLVLGFLVFAVILGGFVYLSKRISKGTALSGKRLKVLERLMLSKDASILLLQVGLRLVVVGAGRDGITLLLELSPSDFAEAQKKTEESPRGFLSRFTRNMKTNFTGSAGSTVDATFAELLRKMEEKDPVTGAAEDAGNAGYPHIQDDQPSWQRVETSAPRRAGYQNEIENMSRLSQPDALDRRAHAETPRYAAPPRRPTPPSASVSHSSEPGNEKERAERIDQLLDLVSQRHARIEDRNKTGDKG